MKTQHATHHPIITDAFLVLDETNDLFAQARFRSAAAAAAAATSS
jgi:hypothetical protein